MAASDIVIFVVDDAPSVLTALGRLLRSAGRRVETFTSARDFLDHACYDIPCLRVLDIQMPDLSGFDLKKHPTASGLNIPVLFIGCGSFRTIPGAFKTPPPADIRMGRPQDAHKGLCYRQLKLPVA